MSKREQVLVIEPPNELTFQGPFTTAVSSFMKLKNPSDKKVSFKIKATAPKLYCVKPNSGVLDPRSEVQIAVSLQPFKYDPTKKNLQKLIVQSLFPPEGEINQDTLWKEMEHDLMKSKLKCVFVMPQAELNNVEEPKYENTRNIVNQASPPKDYFFDPRLLTDGAPRACGKVGHLVADCPNKKACDHRRKEREERQMSNKEDTARIRDQNVVGHEERSLAGKLVKIPTDRSRDDAKLENSLFGDANESNVSKVKSNHGIQQQTSQVENHVKEVRVKGKSSQIVNEITAANAPASVKKEANGKSSCVTKSPISRIKIKSVADLNSDLYDDKADVKVFIGPEIWQPNPIDIIKTDNACDLFNSTYIEPDDIEVPEENIKTELPKEEYNQTKINMIEFEKASVNIIGVDKILPVADFANSGLHPILQENLSKCGYTNPSPIQRSCLPIIMAGRDVIASSQSGSGKTAAYLLPIIHKLIKCGATSNVGAGSQTPQCIIITPTKETALRVQNETEKFSPGSPVKSCVAYGGNPVESQVGNLSKGCNILIVTPGRLLEFVEKGNVSLVDLRCLVLDDTEVLRFHDNGLNGFGPFILQILDKTDKAVQKILMFSMASPREDASMKFLNNRLLVTVGVVGGFFPSVTQKFYAIDGKLEKQKKLLEILKAGNFKEKVLIFSRNQRTSDLIAYRLSEVGLSAACIHQHLPLREQERVLRDFDLGEISIIVSTTMAVRGISIKDVAHVINYEMPFEMSEYIYRIGISCQNLGNTGKSTTLFDKSTLRTSFKAASNASDLVKMLDNCDMDVPEWLAPVRDKNDIKKKSKSRKRKRRQKMEAVNTGKKSKRNSYTDNFSEEEEKDTGDTGIESDKETLSESNHFRSGRIKTDRMGNLFTAGRYMERPGGGWGSCGGAYSGSGWSDKHTEDYGNHNKEYGDFTKKYGAIKEYRDCTKEDGEYGDHTKQYGDYTKYGDLTKQLGDHTKQYGDSTKQYGDSTKKYGDHTKKYGDHTKQYGDHTKQYGDHTKPYSYRTRQYGDHTEKYSDNSKEYHYGEHRNEYDERGYDRGNPPSQYYRPERSRRYK